MTNLTIKGPSRIRGEVNVRGAKNATLPALVAAAAGSERSLLQNVPLDMTDVDAELQALEFIGASVSRSEGSVSVDPSAIHGRSLPPEVSGRFRTSLLFLGLLLGKCGKSTVTMPGGCNLGDRRFDLHLEGLRCLGAHVSIDGNRISARTNGLRGADIEFYLPSTTATENVILAALFAEGRTRIFNANTRPEISDMARLLNAMGAEVSVRNRVVEVEGGRPLSGCQHRIMSGWDEALTYIIAAGMTGGEVCVRDFGLTHIRTDVEYLCRAGMDIFEWGGNVYATGASKELRRFDLFTAPYPGVNSDLQPLFAAFASQCDGESSVTDQRFTERFQYIAELQKFGMAIESYGNCAVIRGPSRLEGARVTALDLRCGAALVLAALRAHGTTRIENASQLSRGYEQLVPRLRALGSDIEFCE